MCLQGRFKSPLHFDDVLTGQHFPGPLQKVPAKCVVNKIFEFCKQINPSMDIGSVTKPTFLAPVIAAAQAIHVAVPGLEPSLEASPAEDMRLLGPAFVTATGVRSTMYAM